LIYFHSKDKLPAHVYGKIASIATLGAIQFFYGRRMVYNKLEGDKKLQEHDHRTQYDHLDPYGLIVHVCIIYNPMHIFFYVKSDTPYHNRMLLTLQIFHYCFGRALN
jgi:hypothetical protein